jgi:hypothetical protein
MGEVYKYSYCNIAATAADDGRSGCFLKTNPLLARACRIKVTDTCPRARLPVGTYELIDSELWSASLLEAPLNEGTWVVQERFLAPRIWQRSIVLGVFGAGMFSQRLSSLSDGL